MSSLRKFALLVVAVLALASCGGESELDLVSQVSGAAGATLGAETARASFTTSTLGQEITFDGVFDFADRAGKFTAPASAMGFGTGDTTFLYDFSDGMVMYIALPSGFQAQVGAAYLTMDLGAAMAQAGIDADMAEIIQSQSSDPTSGLQFLRGASEVTEVGTEVIRDTETRHLQVTVDLAKLVENTPESARDDMAKLVDLYTVDTLPIEVWLDDQDRVRRFRQEIDYSTFQLPGNPDLGAMAGQTQTIDVEYYDFGTPVDVQFPSDDETMSFQEFIAKASGG